MNYRKLETFREVRLWVVQIIVPSILIGAAVLSDPNVKKFITDKKKAFNEKQDNLKTKIKNNIF